MRVTIIMILGTRSTGKCWQPSGAGLLLSTDESPSGTLLPLVVLLLTSPALLFEFPRKDSRARWSLSLIKRRWSHPQHDWAAAASELPWAPPGAVPGSHRGVSALPLEVGVAEA